MINAPEYWILESTSDSMQALGSLREDYVEDVFNRRGHGLNRTQLVNVLDGMFSRGELFAEREFRRQAGVHEYEIFKPTLSGLAKFFEDPKGVVYGMTSRGAGLWEEISKPDWNQFVSGELWFDDNRYVGRSCNRQALQDYVSQVDLKKWIATEIMWKTIQNWEATYWKTLPVGYEISFEVKPVDEDPHFPFNFPMARSEGQWYFNPFTMLPHIRKYHVYGE